MEREAEWEVEGEEEEGKEGLGGNFIGNFIRYGMTAG